MSEPALAVVSGGSGTVGPAVIRRMRTAGYRVRSFSRTPPDPELIPPDVEVVLGDLREPDMAAAAVRGADVVLHLAGILHRRVVDEQVRRAYQSVNVNGTRVVRDAAAGAGVRRLILFSTINVYGPGDGVRVFDEDAEPHPGNEYAASKLAAEHIVLEASAGPPAVVLRLAAVYGPAMRANYGALIRAMRAGIFIPVGECVNRRTLVHVEDVAEAALLAAEHPAAPGRVFNVTDGELHTFGAILEAISAGLERRPVRLRLPERPLRVVLAAAGRVPGLGESARRAGALLDTLTGDIAVSGDRMQRELGYRPKYELRRGWADALSRTGGSPAGLAQGG